MNMQVAEPCHAQSSGRAPQAPRVSRICTDGFCQEEALSGSQLKVEQLHRLFLFQFFMKWFQALFRFADESLIFLTINKSTKEEISQNHPNAPDAFLILSPILKTGFEAGKYNHSLVWLFKLTFKEMDFKSNQTLLCRKINKNEQNRHLNCKN